MYIYTYTHTNTTNYYHACQVTNVVHRMVICMYVYIYIYIVVVVSYPADLHKSAVDSTLWRHKQQPGCSENDSCSLTGSAYKPTRTDPRQ